MTKTATSTAAHPHRRNPDRDLFHHADRGIQYACDDYQKILDDHGFQPSVSAKADCYDNAPTESFWGTLKNELINLVNHENDATREQAKQAIFEYIEVFYNRQRLGYHSPEAFEAGLNE